MQVELLTKYECIQKSSPYPIEELLNLSSYLGTHSQQMIHFIHFFGHAQSLRPPAQITSNHNSIHSYPIQSEKHPQLHVV